MKPDGRPVDKFCYDADRGAGREEIYVRPHDESAFFARQKSEAVLADLRDNGVAKPHCHIKEDGKVWVNVFHNGHLWYQKECPESGEITFPVIPGQYQVVCTTTVQYLDKTIMGEPIEFTPGSSLAVLPDLTEGREVRGRYELYQISLETADTWVRFSYRRLYTYAVVTSTITYVMPGQDDMAAVCIATDPDHLMKLASPSNHTVESHADLQTSQYPLPDEDHWEYVTNKAIETAFTETVGSFLDEGFNKCLKRFKSTPWLASAAANVIYVMVDPATDLNAETLASIGLAVGVNVVAVSVGVTGLPLVVVGVVASVAIDEFWDQHYAEEFRQRMAEAGVSVLVKILAIRKAMVWVLPVPALASIRWLPFRGKCSTSSAERPSRTVSTSYPSWERVRSINSQITGSSSTTRTF